MYWGAVFCAIIVSTCCYWGCIGAVLYNLLNVQYSFQLYKLTWWNCFSHSVDVWKKCPNRCLRDKKLSERQREEKKHKYEKKQLIYRSHGRVVLPSQNPIQSNCVEMLICLHCKMSAYFDSFPSFCQSKNLYKVNWQEKLNYLTLS